MQFSTARLCLLLLPMLVHCSATSGSEAQSTSKSATPLAASSAKPAEVVFLPAGAQAVRVRVEVVQTPEGRQRGLMFRKQLEPDAGMLFIFEQAQQLTFWMRNTYLPLDIIFVKDDMTILGVVENATPMTDAPRAVSGLSRYVVEVNAGFSRSHGLRAGTKLDFVRVPAQDAR